MKVLINKTHEIEVDEKFRDMFPMKGCGGIKCVGCPFDTDEECLVTSKDIEIDIFDFTAEIVEDKIKFEDLKIDQKIWQGKMECTIKKKVSTETQEYIVRELELVCCTSGLRFSCCFDNKENCLSFTPHKKKKVTKTIEAEVMVDLKTNQAEFLVKPGDEYSYTNNFIKVRLSGSYTVEE